MPNLNADLESAKTRILEIQNSIALQMRVCSDCPTAGWIRLWENACLMSGATICGERQSMQISSNPELPEDRS